MSRISKKIVIILSVILIAALFAACDANTGNQNPTEAKQSSNPAAETTKEEPLTIKLFANLYPPEAGTSKWTEEFLKKWETENNIKLELEVPPSTNYTERLQLMLASMIYPDAVMFSDHNDPIFRDAIKQEVIIPITKYLQSATNFQKYTYEQSWKAVQHSNGEIYIIPRTSIARYDGVGIRADWMANVGLEIPKDNMMTIDEFTEMLKRFTKNDPDKNGSDDTYGIAPPQKSITPIFVDVFGVLGWQEYEDEEYKYMDLRYSRKKDNYKRALEYTAMLWKEGYIHPDWPVYASNTEAFHGGKAGVMKMFAGHVHRNLDSIRGNAPDAELEYIVGLKDESGKVYGAGGITGVWGGFGITKSASNPQRIVEAFDWLLSDEAWDMIKYGPEGITYNVVDGKKVPIPEEYGKPTWVTYFARRNNDPEFFLSLGTPDDERKKVNNWIQGAMDAMVFSLDLGHRPEAADDPAFIDADNRLQETVARIILGDLPVSAYDNALDDWYKNGGEQYVKQMNEYIDSIK